MIDIVDTYSWSDFHKAGDVILVFSGGIGSQLNTRIQSLLRGHKAHFSHVMLCVAPGLYAHSITKRGVTYELAEQYPISTIATNFKVFRHRHLCKDLNSFAKITTAAAYHAKKGYNWLLIIPLLRQYFQRTVFCSEFVCRVFSSLDPQYHLTPNPLFTLPVDIEKNIADNSDNWNDVTGAYIEADNAYAANPQNLHEFYDSRKLFFYLLKMTIEQVNSHIDFLNEWASLDNALKHLLRTKSPKNYQTHWNSRATVQNALLYITLQSGN